MTNGDNKGKLQRGRGQGLLSFYFMSVRFTAQKSCVISGYFFVTIWSQSEYECFVARDGLSVIIFFKTFI